MAEWKTLYLIDLFASARAHARVFRSTTSRLWSTIATVYKFASNYIRICAFHNAISRSYVLLRSNTSRRRQTWKKIPLLTHGGRPTGLLQSKARARQEVKKWKQRKKKRCGFIMLVIGSAAASCGIPSDPRRYYSPGIYSKIHTTQRY